MTEIRRALRIAAWRLYAVDVARTLAVTLTAAVGALILLRIAERVFGLPVSTSLWIQSSAGAIGAAVVAALAWSLIRRYRGVALARQLDERANLRESLSTALCVARMDDPWAQAVVETARQRAASLNVSAAIPISAPRMWPVPLATGVALAIVWFSLPQLDILGSARDRQARVKEQQEIQQVKADVAKAEDRVKELASKAGVELKDEKADDKGDAPEPQKPEEIRKAAVKRLTSLQDKLNEMKGGDKAQKMEALRQAMRQLKQPGPGPMDELAKSLSKGDFKQAQDQLEELSKKLASDSLPAEQKEQLKQQMQKMAEQLDKLAKNKDELEKKLEQAGLKKDDVKKLAANPEALKQALEKLENLSQEQKQQLLKMAQCSSGACEQMGEMAAQMGKMASGLSPEGLDGEGMQGMEALAGSLSELEQMDADMASIDAALSECSGKLASLGSQMGNCDGDGFGEGEPRISPWQAGDSNGFGNGSGGPGHGLGPSGGAEEAPIAIKKEKSPTKLGNGPIIGSRLVQGDTIKGESAAEFSEAVEASATAASEALETMTIPREYHDAVKTYFGRLQAKVKGSRPADTK